jgi:hypothetical protein
MDQLNSEVKVLGPLQLDQLCTGAVGIHKKTRKIRSKTENAQKVF